MKRSTELIPLSREHHHALSLARRILAQAGEATALQALRAQVMQDMHELLAHFRAEEDSLLPAMAQHQPALAQRLDEEHRSLRDYLQRIEAGAWHCLPAFARLLQQHVRFEEREFFPAFEALAVAA